MTSGYVKVGKFFDEPSDCHLLVTSPLRELAQLDVLRTGDFVPVRQGLFLAAICTSVPVQMKIFKGKQTWTLS
jgi:hypothetical protein